MLMRELIDQHVCRDIESATMNLNKWLWLIVVLVDFLNIVVL